MQHTPKRILALLLTLVMVLSMFPTGVFAAGEPSAATDVDAVSSAQPAAPDRTAPNAPDQPRSSYQFTTQPQGATIAPGESHTFTWATDFTPVRVEIVARKTALTTGTVTDEVIDTLPADAGSYTLTYNQVRQLGAFSSSVKFLVRAVYLGNHDSNLFEIKLVPYSFTKQPQSGSVTEGGSYKFTWKTNFTPSVIQIVARKTPLIGGDTSDEVIDTLPGTAVSYTMTYQKVAAASLYSSKTQFFVLADGVASNLFDIERIDKYFTAQPQDGTVYMNDDLTIAWRTNFTPTQIKLCREVSGSGSTAVFEPFATLSGTATSYDLSYTKAISFGTNARYQVWAYYNGSDFVKSDPFTVTAVDPSNFTFITQPQGGSADPDSGYTINWSTNFTPVKIEIMLYYIEPGYGNESNFHLISSCPGTATSYHFPYEQVKYWLSTNAASQRNFYIRAYYTDDRYVSSELFNLSLIPRTFTTKPQNGNLPIGGVHTFSWDTNFTPEKIQIAVSYNLPEGGNSEILQVLNGYVKTTAIDYNTVWHYGSSPHEKTKYYVQAFYGSGAGEYISSQFTISFTPYSVSLTQSAQSLVPYESVTYNWSTNFTARKFELVSAYHAGWGEYVDHQVVQTFPGGTGGEKTIDFNTVLHESYASWSGYRIRAYYGDGANDYVSSRIGYVGVTPFKFTGQPQGGTVTPRTPFVFSWATNYEPTCYEVLAYYVSQETNDYGFHDTSWETVAELNAGTHSYSLNYSTIAEYVRDSYVYVKLRAPDPSGAYVESDPIQVLVSGTVFSTQPQSSVTLSEGGSPATLLWSLSAELSSQKLMLIPDGQTEPIVLKLLSRQDESCTVSFSELEAKYRELGLNAETGKLFIQAVSGGCTYNSISVTFTLNYNSSGTTGGLHWEYLKNGRLLKISGTGDMPDYSSVSIVPWRHFVPQIYTVIINSGVTGIGKNAFNGCANLKTVQVPASVTAIHENAFANCSSLTNVNYVGSQKAWSGISIDSGNTRLTSATKTFTHIDDGACGDSLTWRLENDGTLKITGTGAMANYTSSSYAPWYDYRTQIVKVVIGSGVTSVGDYAFTACTALTTVNASAAALTSVGQYAFSGCTKLKTLSGFDSSSIGSFGIRAFQNCKALTGFAFPAGITTIPNYMFYGASGLTSVSIPAAVKSINNYAFSKCTSLSSVVIPTDSQMTTVNSYAFRGCTKLSSITLPEGVKYLYTYAFADCSKLSSVRLPSSLSTLGSYVFQNCTSLSGSITIPANVTTIAESTFDGCSGITAVYFAGTNITAIGKNAFRNCTSLTWMMNVPSGVVTIGEGAFQNCQFDLIYLPNSLTTIGVNAFNGCTPLSTGIVYFSGVEAQWNAISIGTGNGPLLSARRTYEGLYGMIGEMYWSVSATGVLRLSANDEIAMPSIPSTRPWAAANSSITKISVYNLTSVAANAFTGLTKVKEVTLDSTVKTIGSGAFSACSALTDVTYLALESAWSSVTVGSNNTPFNNATKHFLERVEEEMGGDLGWKLTETGDLYIYSTHWDSWDDEMEDFTAGGAPWYGYRNIIRAVYLEDEEVFGIGEYAFYGLSNLTTVYIPAEVREHGIGKGAFQGCESLTDVYFGSISYDWNRMDVGDDNDDLYYNYYLDEDIDFHWGKARGDVEDTFLDWEIDESGTMRIYSPSGYGSSNSSNYAIPDYTDEQEPPSWGDYAPVIRKIVLEEGVNRIGADAFDDFHYDSYHLTEIEIPDSVTSIGNGALARTDLVRVVFPDSVTEMGTSVLFSCTKLTSVTFPAGISAIPNTMCYNLSALESVVIPEGITSIGTNAFSSCTNLKTVWLPSTLTTVGDGAFRWDTSLKDVYIDEYWFNVDISFGSNNAPIQASTVTWHYKEYGGVLETGLRWELRPDGCLEITGDGAMPNLSAGTAQPWGEKRKQITSLEIGDGVTSVGDYAFWCCTNLASFSLPESLTRIGNYAFHQCYALNNVELPSSLTVIDTYGFSQCTGLTQIVLPDSVSTLGKNAFHLCTSLVSVKLSYNLTTVNMYTFMKCTSLQTVEIQENVTTVNLAAFGGCPEEMSVIYYGTQAQWNKITISKNNYTLNNVIYNNDPLINAGKTFLGVALTMKNFGNLNLCEYLSGKDTNHDGCLSTSECSSVTELNISNMGVTDLSVIYGLFPNLKKLNCSNNPLDVVIPEYFENLETLDFSNCEVEGYVDFSCNSWLKDVNCSGNQINQFDLCVSMKYLDCSNNELTMLDLDSSAANLIQLDCSGNLITQISCTGMPNLVILDCSDNLLTALDLSGMPDLERLFASHNRLESLDASAVGNLAYLDCSYNGMTQLLLPDILTSLCCEGNALPELDLSGTPELLRAVKEGVRTETGSAVEYSLDENESLLRVDSTVSFTGLPSQVEIWFVYKPNVVGQTPADIYVYAYGNGTSNAAWPGVKLEGEDRIEVVCDAGTGNATICYAYRFVADTYRYHHVIFSNGTDSNKTADLDFTAGVIEGEENLYRIWYANAFNDLSDGADVWPDSSKITHYPSCTEPGTDSWFGLLSLETKTETLAALGHDLTSVEVHAPGCTAQGWTDFACSRCDYTEAGAFTEPTGHIVGDWIVTVQPGCTAEGEQQRTCSVCGESEVAPIAALGHDWGEASYSFSDVAEPGEPMTCTAAIACARCGSIENETVSGVYTVILQPNALEAGLGSYSFSFTDFRFAGQLRLVELPMLPAEYVTVYVVDRSDAMDLTALLSGAGFESGGNAFCPAGVDKDGNLYYGFDVNVTAYPNLVLSDLESRQYPTDGSLHPANDAAGKGWVVYGIGVDYTAQTEADVWPAPGAVVSEPTCTENGQTSYTGLLTGQTVTVATPALGHAFVEGVCIRCGAADPNYLPFGDVPPAAWYFEPVAWAYNHEPQITAGTSPEEFSPNQDCTRAQIVTFLWRANGSPEPGLAASPFTDVQNPDAYYYKPVLWAYENGITNGVSAKLFGVNRTCTRAQVVTFLWRAFGSQEPTLSQSPFEDVTNTGSWYYKPVLWAVENGITAGMDPTHFAPNETCTRGQVVTFLYSAYSTPADIPIDEAHFPDAAFREHLSDTFYGYDDGDGVLSATEIANLTHLFIECDTRVTSLEGIEYLTELEELETGENGIISLDLRKNRKLTSVYVCYNPLTELRIEGLNLTYLNIDATPLTEMDLTEFTELERLSYGECENLTSLILGSKPNLYELYSYDNALPYLDLSTCPLLLDVYLNGDQKTWPGGYIEYYKTVGGQKRMLYVNEDCVININSD